MSPFVREHPSTTESPRWAGGRGHKAVSLCRSAASECGVAGKSAGQDVSCCCKFLTDEPQAKKPGAHRVLWILVLLRLCAGASYFLCHLAECQAKLDVAFQLSGVKAVELAIGGCVELEKPEFHRALGESGVEVKHVIAASVVVLASAVAFALAGVPDVCKLRHGLRLLLVDRLEESLVNRSAVAAYPVFVQGQGILQKAFVAGHDVGEVSEGMRCVAFCSDVNVYLMESNA